MAVPGEDSRDFPVRVTKEGADRIDQEAERLGIEKAQVFRIALEDYFKRQGQTIEFTPKRGGKRTRMNEQETFKRVVDRVQALGLPEPVAQHSLRHKVYDLAWPDKQVAVEISAQKKPADTNGWTVGVVRTTMKDEEIDKVLKNLPLT